MELGEERAIADIGVDDRQVGWGGPEFRRGRSNGRRHAGQQLGMAKRQADDLSQDWLVEHDQHEWRGLRSADRALQGELPSLADGPAPARTLPPAEVQVLTVSYSNDLPS